MRTTLNALTAAAAIAICAALYPLATALAVALLLAIHYGTRWYITRGKNAPPLRARLFGRIGGMASEGLILRFAGRVWGQERSREWKESFGG